MANESPAFQFYPADFLSDKNVLAMSGERGMAQRGVYITLLAVCWREGSLPDDVEELADVCGCDAIAFRDLWQKVERCFHKVGGRLRHKRLDAERKKQEEHRETKKKAGRAGADARWHKEDRSSRIASHSDRSAVAKADDSSSSSSSSSSSGTTNPPHQAELDGSPPPAQKPKGKHLLPADWEPKEDHRRIAVEEGRDLAREVERMRDWARGGRIMKADWDAVLRNWLRSERRTNGNGDHRGGSSAGPRGAGVAGTAGGAARASRIGGGQGQYRIEG